MKSKTSFLMKLYRNIKFLLLSTIRALRSGTNLYKNLQSVLYAILIVSLFCCYFNTPIVELIICTSLLSLIFRSTYDYFLTYVDSIVKFFIFVFFLLLLIPILIVIYVILVIIVPIVVTIRIFKTR